MGYCARLNDVRADAAAAVAFIVGIEGDTVTVEDNKAGAVSFPLDNIHSAKLVLTDELIAATQPLDTTGAEDIVEDETEKADD